MRARVNVWIWGTVLLWFVCAVVPACLSLRAATPTLQNQIEELTHLYGQDTGGYLGYCPAPLIGYVRGLLFLSPVLMLLISTGQSEWCSDGPGVAARLSRLISQWLLLSVPGLAIVALASSFRLGEASNVWAWVLHLALPLIISALPAIGWAMLVKSAFSSRSVGFVVGSGGLAILGYLAFLSRILRLPGVPGSIDPLLFSGVPAHELNGTALACTWLSVTLLVVTALQRRGAPDCAEHCTALSGAAKS